MGCLNSKAPPSKATKKAGDKKTTSAEDEMKKGNEYTANITGGPLSQKEYNSRVVTSNGPQTVKVPLPEEGGHYTLTYAIVSQRGYYPEALNKANQDAYCVHTRFGGRPEEHFFGIFDGHGEFGTPCAQFAKDKVRVHRREGVLQQRAPQPCFPPVRQIPSVLRQFSPPVPSMVTTTCACLHRRRSGSRLTFGHFRACVRAFNFLSARLAPPGPN